MANADGAARGRLINVTLSEEDLAELKKEASIASGIPQAVLLRRGGLEEARRAARGQTAALRTTCRAQNLNSPHRDRPAERAANPRE